MRKRIARLCAVTVLAAGAFVVHPIQQARADDPLDAALVTELLNVVMAAIHPSYQTECEACDEYAEELGDEVHSGEKSIGDAAQDYLDFYELMHG